MVLDHRFADEFSSLDSSFVNYDFMMLAELDFVVFDCVVERFIFLVAVLDIMYDLEQIDRDGKNLSSGLKHLLVLFDNGFILFL